MGLGLALGTLVACEREGAVGPEAPSCQLWEAACPGGCADLQSSPDNCGACGFACAPGHVCQAGACTDLCGQGMGFCGAQCVSLASSPAHCGACDSPCPAGQLCVNGACSFTCEQTVCPGSVGPECVALSDDPAHCGACSSPCLQGQICVGGQCVLDCGALTECTGACVDLQSDDLHCGACGVACPVDTECQGGACVCAPGLSICGDACVDTATDSDNCGGCGQRCGDDSLCEGGRCVGPDGCTDVPVAGLSLSAIDAYQSLQIPIMEEGTAIAREARNADLVAAREVLFRVHVVPEAGWTPREISARIELTDVEAPEPDQRQLFFSTLTPMVASSNADADSTFQVMAPAELIGPETRYSVTLVECGPPPAADAPAAAARFPADGHEVLGARETGPLEVHIVPVGGGGSPDVSEVGLAAFKERLEAVFPVTEVIFTVGDPLQGTASSMCSLLGSISSRRSQDGAPAHVYYYGLTAGILGGQSGCSDANLSASSPKVSVGWAQGFTHDDGSTGAATMCHELGHAHGRLHAPCNVQDPDRRYPYPDADIGVWAYDERNGEFYEPTRKDMMSYCPEPRSDAWISDYNYQAILERVVEVNALAEVPAGAVLPLVRKVPWRMLVSDSAGLHWVEEPLLVAGTPGGEPVHAVVHGRDGPMQHLEVYKRELHDGVQEGAFMLVLPELDDSWCAIEVPGLLPQQPLGGC